ncbi:hypothetical protein PpBr36_02536 [Pyricularia pennisetigena]|uniref:hypothetical protein n=1 Tax=Pyricularia pennisetigena TaxID=1578925 RepID=UPI001150FA92|nr:hypothetical protein PpBr36_02536 [Pyricularia pennisetigena]TLS31444.1 hypothetical protein PpBr36_02536 [Pyricularia pennisetigena]
MSKPWLCDAKADWRSKDPEPRALTMDQDAGARTGKFGGALSVSSEEVGLSAAGTVESTMIDQSDIWQSATACQPMLVVIRQILEMEQPLDRGQ